MIIVWVAGFRGELVCGEGGVRYGSLTGPRNPSQAGQWKVWLKLK